MGVLVLPGFTAAAYNRAPAGLPGVISYAAIHLTARRTALARAYAALPAAPRPPTRVTQRTAPERLRARGWAAPGAGGLVRSASESPVSPDSRARGCDRLLSEASA